MKKDKYLQIFNYLLEFSKLRSNPIRNIFSSEAYENIIWLADLPVNKSIECALDPNFDTQNTHLLSVLKPIAPQPPIFPQPPDDLKSWIDNEIAEQKTMPLLKEAIKTGDSELLLADFPEVRKQFEQYLNGQWENDVIIYNQKCNEFESLNNQFLTLRKTYNDLFRIYNKTQQFGEEYELVLAVGFLYFKEADDKQLIARHILTIKADIAFDSLSAESSIKVITGVDSEPRFELDSFIDLNEIFDTADVIDAESLAYKFLVEKEITDLLGDKDIFDALRIFADRFRSDGIFQEDIRKPTISAAPKICFSPALILRKRNTKTFSSLYEKIIKNIQLSDDSLDIPAINDLVDTETGSEKGDGPPHTFIPNFSDDIIYFPKKYNDEQVEIIKKTNFNNKVLVQGPPGTGKSHTIGNVICHLLANGKKVLVTAYNKRALEVLKKQLPEDFQRLTVNLLSGDVDSIKDLESSVNAINDELSKANLEDHQKNSALLLTEFNETNKKLAGLKNQWLAVNEKGSRKIVINHLYEDTLIAIAERLESEAVSFEWFKDDFFDLNNLAIVDHVISFVDQTEAYASFNLKSFSQFIPDPFNILSEEEFREYIRIQVVLEEKYLGKDKANFIECSNYDVLLASLKKLLEIKIAVESCNFPFKNQIENDVVTNRLYWVDKLSRTSSLISELSVEKLKHFDTNIEITYPTAKSLKVLKNDAQIFIDLVKAGKKLSGFNSIFINPFLNADLKEKKYFIEGTKVNNNRCDKIETINLLMEDLQIKQIFESLDQIWAGATLTNAISYYDKFFHYKNLQSAAEGLISNLDKAKALATEIQIASMIKVNVGDSKILKDLIENIDYSALIQRSKAIRDTFEITKRTLTADHCHPFCGVILNDLIQNDCDRYSMRLTELSQLIKRKEEYNEYINLKEQLSGKLPLLVSAILSFKIEREQIKQMNNCLYYSHARHELNKLLARDYTENVLTQIAYLENNVDQVISKLATHKAWISVLQRLEEKRTLRKHLEAWVLAVSKIGKTGVGKKALKFRKEAQAQMEKCKDSVPCWIMPLYKVAETINPEVEMYDYVIIDEASQLGPDAIFLLYIAKNIIIVGDDKQTSPEYVGVDSNSMAPHITRHLKNIPFSNFYGTEFSFFDHAKLFCNGMTVLREHFRCMPEIIEFSNKHFYAPDGKGLYPLKQYSENRIEPIKAVFCPTGFTEGQYANIINTEEAELLVNTIVELIKDPKYKDKSFGIIGLQGNKQSLVIENLLLKKISEQEYHQRKIICGNSASFQGDERDIMFLSLITAQNHKRMPLTKPEDERRFNVAMSRAKEQVWLFHSVQLEDLQSKNKDVVDLRFKLLNHFQNYKVERFVSTKKIKRGLSTQPAPFESWFEVDVYNDITDKGYSVIPQYEVAKGKYRIDLVIILPNGTKIAIECDGDKFHGPEHYLADLNRQKVLERCGWQFFRVRGVDYYTNRRNSLEALWRLLESNGNLF